MAKQVLGQNTTVTINGTNLSDHVAQVTLEDSADEVEVTGFQEAYKEYLPGLKDATVTLQMFQDYGGTSVDPVIGGLYYANAAGTIKVNPDTAGTVVYTMVGKVYTFSPVDGSPGAANQTQVVFRNSGTAGLTRGTA